MTCLSLPRSSFLSLSCVSPCVSLRDVVVALNSILEVWLAALQRTESFTGATVDCCPTNRKFYRCEVIRFLPVGLQS